MICRRLIWRRGAQLAREARPVRDDARALIAYLGEDRRTGVAMMQMRLALARDHMEPRLFAAATRPLAAYCRRGIAAIGQEWKR